MARSRINEASLTLMLLKDIDHFNSLYLQARPTLLNFGETPREMTDEEWNKVVSALSGCSQSVKFLFRIAMLAEAGIVGRDMLCIMYYDEITKYLTEKLNQLVKWCGTGLDLAADYDAYELASMIRSLLKLVKKMDDVNRKYGLGSKAEANQVMVSRFEERVREFLRHSDRFDLLSENYIDNYVKISGME